MGSCKSQRSSYVYETGTGSASIDECLPQEMVEAILGKLDRQTLCTARLVSRTFCAAASANISSLTLRSPPQTVSLERFPNLGHVRVHHPVTEYSLAQLDPRLRAVITHLTVSHGRSPGRMALPELPGMLKLRELDMNMDYYHHPSRFCLVDGAAILHRLPNLEVLRIPSCTLSVAMTITTSTRLTSLVIGVVTEPGEGRRSEDVSWLRHATNLRRLQALHITVSPKASPLIGNLTGLTGLTWMGGVDDMEDSFSIAPLSHLSRLRSLRIHPWLSVSNLAVAYSLGSGSLAKLSVSGTHYASADCEGLLARQTALKRLSVGKEQLCNLRNMGAPRMESLQSLGLHRVGDLDAEGLAVLQKATSLTKLGITTWAEQPNPGLSETVGRLTQLRCLHLEMQCWSKMDLPLALGPLTALTELNILWGHPANGDWRGLLGLTGLQELYLRGCRLTDDVLLELAVLTNLRKLVLQECGVSSLAPATNILNPLRHARGWPPVDTRCN